MNKWFSAIDYWTQRICITYVVLPICIFHLKPLSIDIFSKLLTKKNSTEIWMPREYCIGMGKWHPMLLWGNFNEKTIVKVGKCIVNAFQVLINLQIDFHMDATCLKSISNANETVNQKKRKNIPMKINACD